MDSKTKVMLTMTATGAALFASVALTAGTAMADDNTNDKTPAPVPAASQNAPKPAENIPTVAEAKKNEQETRDNLNNAEKDVKQAQTENDTAEKQVQTETDKQDDLQKQEAQSNETLQNVTTGHDNVAKQVDEVQSNVTKLQSEEKTTSQNVTDTTETEKTAQTAVNNSMDTLNKEVQKLPEQYLKNSPLSRVKTTTSEELSKMQNALTIDNKNLSDQMDKIKDIQKDRADMAQQASEFMASKQKLAQELDNAQKNLDNTKKKVADAITAYKLKNQSMSKEDYEKLQNEVKQAENAVKEAKKNVDDVVRKNLTQGYADFLKFVIADKTASKAEKADAQRALNLLNGKADPTITPDNTTKPEWYDTRVKLNTKDPNRGDYMRNLKASVTYMRIINAYRKARGLKPIAVSYTSTAVSVIDSFYSDENIGHAMYYSTFENLAWNPAVKVGEPYAGDVNDAKEDDLKTYMWQWITKEKALYDKYIAEGKTPEEIGNGPLYHKVGHYLNFMTADLTDMGFTLAYNAKNPYGTIGVWNANWDGGITVDEYDNRINEFALANMSETERKETEGKLAIYNNASKTLQDKSNKLSNVSVNTGNVENNEKLAKKAGVEKEYNQISALKNTVSETKDKLTDVTVKYNRAKNYVNTFDDKLQKANEFADTLREYITGIKENIEKLKKRSTYTDKEFMDAVDNFIKTGASPDIVDVRVAKENYDKNVKKLQQAQKNVKTAAKAHNNAVAKLKTATETLNTLTNTKSALEAKMNSTKAEHKQLVVKVNAQKEVVKAAKQAAKRTATKLANVTKKFNEAKVLHDKAVNMLAKAMVNEKNNTHDTTPVTPANPSHNEEHHDGGTTPTGPEHKHNTTPVTPEGDHGTTPTPAPVVPPTPKPVVPVEPDHHETVTPQPSHEGETTPTVTPSHENEHHENPTPAKSEHHENVTPKPKPVTPSHQEENPAVPVEEHHDGGTTPVVTEHEHNVAPVMPEGNHGTTPVPAPVVPSTPKPVVPTEPEHHEAVTPQPSYNTPAVTPVGSSHVEPVETSTEVATTVVPETNGSTANANVVLSNKKPETPVVENKTADVKASNDTATVKNTSSATTANREKKDAVVHHTDDNTVIKNDVKSETEKDKNTSENNTNTSENSNTVENTPTEKKEAAKDNKKENKQDNKNDKGKKNDNVFTIVAGVVVALVGCGAATVGLFRKK